ncbi:MAG: hypothetical protein ACFNQD_04910 [Prevotella intermedia]|jgi:hypothetical protein|uniref:Uncharacterized protein n=1 Tax=Prevotella intermedia TaxID=28131 RepID=A0A2D3LMM8_PREIN|nr:hypothetical protein [Prevotella intermedia]ATV31761.1 hypothetical protein CTM46_09515 [Prevotella intermedia]PJI21144.1 hypothetical protein CTM45_09895 [Prevotella intermedia]
MKKSFNIKKVYSKPWAEIVNTRIECPILAGSSMNGNAGEAEDDGPPLPSKEGQFFEDDFLPKGKKK